MAPPRRTRTDQLAETLFKRACDLAGGSANPSVDDQYGWDFVFQLPAHASNRPPDLEEAGLTALAQIKSTLKSRSSVGLKLSNALRMAQEATPCFIIVMAFEEGAAEPHSAWVLHIWKDEIAKALEAARRAHLRSTSLHKATLNLPLSDAMKCDPLNIGARIEHEVEAIGRDYAGAKASLRNSVGYEDGRGGGTITFEVTHEDEVFDLLLGRIPDLPVNRVDLREERFGLPGPPLTENAPGRVAIEAKPFEPCQLILCREGEELVFDGQVYVPGIPDLPRNLFRVRFQAQILEVIWRQEGPSAAHARFGLAETYSISTHLQLATLATWLAEGNVELAIWVRQRQFIRGPLALEGFELHDPRWERLRTALDDILKVLPAPRWPAGMTFVLRELFERLEEIETFAIRVARQAVMDLAGAPQQLIDLLPEVDEHLSPVILQFGGVTLYAFIIAKVEGGLGASEDRLTLGIPKVLLRGVLAGSIADNWPFLTQTYGDLGPANAGPKVLHSLLPDRFDAFER